MLAVIIMLALTTVAGAFVYVFNNANSYSNIYEGHSFFKAEG